MAIMHLITAIFIYHYGIKKKFSIIYSAIISVLPLSFYVTQIQILKLWNPSFLPVFFAVIMISFQRLIYEKTSKLEVFLYGLIYGFALQIHYQVLIILSIMFINLINEKTCFKKSSIALIFFGFLISYIPFIEATLIKENWNYGEFFRLHFLALLSFLNNPTSLIKNLNSIRSKIPALCTVLILNIFSNFSNLDRSKIESKFYFHYSLLIFGIILIILIEGDPITRYYYSLPYVFSLYLLNHTIKNKHIKLVFILWFLSHSLLPDINNFVLLIIVTTSSFFYFLKNKLSSEITMILTTVIIVVINMYNINITRDQKRYSSIGVNKITQITEWLYKNYSLDFNELVGKTLLIDFNSTDTFWTNKNVKKSTISNVGILIWRSRSSMPSTLEQSYQELLTLKKIPKSLQDSVTQKKVSLVNYKQLSNIKVIVYELKKTKLTLFPTNTGLGYHNYEIYGNKTPTISVCKDAQLKTDELKKCAITTSFLKNEDKNYLFLHNKYFSQRGEWINPNFNLHLKDVRVRCIGMNEELYISNLGYPNPNQKTINNSYILGPLIIQIPKECNRINISWSSGSIYKWQRTSLIKLKDKSKSIKKFEAFINLK